MKIGFSIWISILSILLILQSCLQNPAEINTSDIDESIQYKGLPTIFLNTNHPINPFEKVNVGISEMDSTDQISKPVYGKIKVRIGDHPEHKKQDSYSIILQKNTSLAGLPSGQEWILRAPSFDPTLLKDKLANHLFNLFDPSAIIARSEIVILYINGSEMGLYILTEKLNENRLQINTHEDGAVIFKEPEIFSPKGKVFNQRFPKINVRDHSRKMFQLQRLFFETSEEDFFSDREGVFSYFDTDNLLSWQLILLLSGDSAAKHQSFYLYRKAQTEKFLFTLWDYENAYGSTWNGASVHPHSMPEDNILFARLISPSQSEYSNLLKNKWHILRKNRIISPYTINQWIDNQFIYVLFYTASRDKSQFYNTSRTTEATDKMKLYIRDRIDFLDHYFNYL